ncbi:MAG: metallophosphoesterase [Myxococcota bacterium]
MPLLLLVSCMSAPGAPVSPEPAPSEAPRPGPTGATAPAAAPPPEGRPAPERLVAIGDLHGDLASALAVFRLAGLVDATGAWAGGKTWLVQTGDITDRGPDSRGVIALMRRLQGEARAAGGEVVPLLGNHEVMNLNGDWRYVSPEDLASYGGEAARKAAYAPTGDDGAWLLAQDGVARVGGTVFAHGGVDARWARLGVRGLNATIRAALLGQGPPEVLGSDGPLWNRTYLLSDPVTACAELGRALTELGATRMVVGHTTQDSGRVAERCGGQLWGIDTGISAHYGGHLAALEIRGDAVTPVYAAP